MVHLMYYQKERIEWKDAFDKKIDSEETRIVIKKLSKHFKIRTPYINFTSGNRISKATSYNDLILNVSYMTWGLVCHELAHSYIFQKDRQHHGHNKYHWKVMKKMIKYCENKEWFWRELARRTEVKIKPEPSKQEIKAKELIRLQENIVRYEKKILFYQRKLSKAKRSYTMRNKYIQMMNSINPILETNNDK